jgi:hypothetical protein
VGGTRKVTNLRTNKTSTYSVTNKIPILVIFFRDSFGQEISKESMIWLIVDAVFTSIAEDEWNSFLAAGLGTQDHNFEDSETFYHTNE